MAILTNQPYENFTAEFVTSLPFIISTLFFGREQREHRIFQELMRVVPGLEGRLAEASEEDVGMLAELVSYQPISL
jgi:hypothetical protein